MHALTIFPKRLPYTAVIVRAFAKGPSRSKNALEHQESLEPDHRSLRTFEPRDHALADTRQIGQTLLTETRDLPCPTKIAAKAD